jgi:uncharacterized membrane protein
MRIASLDVMRGLIIVLMAIDHARAFVAKNHPGEFWGRPLPDYGGDVLAFVTRLISHPCAPGFFFLMGAGMTLFVATRSGETTLKGRATRFLAVRGLALILLGQVFENLSFTFGFANATRMESYGIRVPGADGTAPLVILGVLYGLGAALIVGSVLIRLRPAALLGVAALLVLATDWITPPASQADVRFHAVLRLLLIPGKTGPLLVAYPALAWLPCTLVGMAFARWLLDDRDRAFGRLALMGGSFLVLFVVLRAAGGFGNLTPPVPGWIGFFNTVKYPPALTFLLFALGVDFLLLTAIERRRLAERPWIEPLRVFGAVPFFFFVTHLWLYAVMGRFFPAGTTLAWMYVFWMLGLVLLYLPCKWYGAFKRTRPENSLLRML